MSERYQQGAVIPIEVLALDGSLQPVTGVTDLLLQIRRASDDFFFDFNDSTFKSSGWTTRQQALSEKDATNDQGAYGYDWTSPSADDTYFIRVDQSPGTTVANVPFTGEAIVGGYVDDIDAAISSRSSHDEDDVRDAILSDSTPFAGANIDATISSRSSHDENDVRDAILTDATPFAGANIDAAISSRSSHSAADVWTNPTRTLTSLGGTIQADIANAVWAFVGPPV